MALWTVPHKTTTLTVYTVEAKNATEAAVKAGIIHSVRMTANPDAKDDPAVTVRELSEGWLRAEKVTEG